MIFLFLGLGLGLCLGVLPNYPFRDDICESNPELSHLDWKIDPQRAYNVDHLPQQGRDPSCAIYALAYVLLLALRVPSPWSFSPTDARKLSKQIVIELQNGALIGVDQGIITSHSTSAYRKFT